MAKKNRENNKKYKKIIIYGFMGCGKTTTGILLSQKLNIPFYDTDIEFEKKYGSIKNFVTEKGIRNFRKIEKKIVDKIFKKSNCVISAGGGIFPGGKNADLEVFINAPWKVLYKRLIKDNANRPLLKNFEKNKYKIKKLYLKRLKKYRKAALIIKETDINKIVERIIKVWKSN